MSGYYHQGSDSPYKKYPPTSKYSSLSAMLEGAISNPSHGGNPPSHPSSQMYQQGYGAQNSGMYPNTPYSGGAPQYPSPNVNNMQWAGAPAPQVPSFPQQPYNNNYMSPTSANPAPYGGGHSPYPHSAYSGAQYAPSSTSTIPSTRGAEPNDASVKQCSHCGTMSTPLWRRDPGTHQMLCNACGLYMQQRHAPRPTMLIVANQDDGDTGAVSDAPYDGRECSHCHTRKTSVWRRNKEGEQVCNACGVYQRLKGIPRPESLGTPNKIKPRSRPSQG